MISEEQWRGGAAACWTEDTIPPRACGVPKKNPSIKYLILERRRITIKPLDDSIVRLAAAHQCPSRTDICLLPSADGSIDDEAA
jgi:hypothetical protein